MHLLPQMPAEIPDDKSPSQLRLAFKRFWDPLVQCNSHAQSFAAGNLSHTARMPFPQAETELGDR